MSSVNIPNIPNISSSVISDQLPFLTAVKSMLEELSGQGRNTDNSKAVRVRDLANLNIDISQYLKATSKNPYVISAFTAASFAVPEPPTSLVITKGAFVHTLNWVNPTDTIVSHIEVWCAVGSQDRDDAENIAIFTLTDILRGQAGVYKNPIETVTEDRTYWIRSLSYAGNYSPWHPIDAQGGYIIVGDESVQAAIDGVIAILKGETPEAYSPVKDYIENERCLTVDGRVWTSIYDGAHQGHLPPDATYWKRTGILMTGDVDGTPTVAIDGNLVVDGTILARHIEAESIKAAHIDTSELFVGLSIQSTDYILGLSGWKIANGFSEFNNMVLQFSDSTAMAAAQAALNVADGSTNDADIRSTNASELTKIDGGKIALSSSIQIGNLDGASSYSKMDSGDLEFYHWNGTEHLAYKSVRRYTGGVAENNTIVNIPGFFLATPVVMVSPYEMITSVGIYSALDQVLKCQALSIEEYSLSTGLQEDGTNSWRFTALADITAGSAISTQNLAGVTGTEVVAKLNFYYYFVYTTKATILGSTYTTPTTTTNITVSGVMDAIAAFENSYLYVTVNISVYLEVIGVGTVLLGSAQYASAHVTPIVCSGSFNGSMAVTSGVYSYRIYAIVGGKNYHVNNITLTGTIANAVASFTRSGGTTVPAGSLNWVAQGV